jgi:hypothetical protein
MMMASGAWRLPDMSVDDLLREIPPLDVLVIGLDQDWVLKHLLKAAPPDRNILPVLMAPDQRAEVALDVNTGQLFIEGQLIAPRAVFRRSDTYLKMEDYTPARVTSSQLWYTLFEAWLLANPQIRIFNRSTYAGVTINKAHTLTLARQIGIPIAPTLLTNSLATYNARVAQAAQVYKSITDGGFTRSAEPVVHDETVRVMKDPLCLQGRLSGPEARIFRIGQQLFALKITSESLDYREKSDASMQPWPELERGTFAERFIKLTDAMKLDFCAADFKTDPVSGELCLLEVNDGPMFAYYDNVLSGRLTPAIWQFLLG